MNTNTSHRHLPLFAIIASYSREGELDPKTVQSRWFHAQALNPQYTNSRKLQAELYDRALKAGIDQEFIKRKTDGNLVITDAGRRWWSETRRLSECPFSDSNYLRADWWTKVRSLGA